MTYDRDEVVIATGMRVIVILFALMVSLASGFVLAKALQPSSPPPPPPPPPCITAPCISPPEPGEDFPVGIPPLQPPSPYPDEPRYRVCWNNPVPNKC